MSSIITYDSNLGNGDGAFITPNNEIILTYGEHERFAAKYCGGRDLFFLINLRTLFHQVN